MACDGPHSPYQCVVAQALNESMRNEGEPAINMFEYTVDSDYESSKDEASEYDVLRSNANFQIQLTLDRHPTLNVITIEDQEIHLTRPSEQEVKNLPKATIAKAKHNYNLRNSKDDEDQGKTGSMFFKQISSKRTIENKAFVKYSQAKSDQSSNSGKPDIFDTTGNKVETTGDKRTSRQKIEKVKAYDESNVDYVFNMTQALT